MAGNVVEVSDAEFESSIVQSDKPALVDFWAEWCQPCKMLAPVVEEIAGEYIDKVRVAKVNVDDNPAIATKFGIRGIPTLLLFKEGKVVQQMVGVKPKADITKAIDEIL
jgi:thioredoxin 1